MNKKINFIEHILGLKQTKNSRSNFIAYFIVSILLLSSILFIFNTPHAMAQGNSYKYEKEAYIMHSLGLLDGTSTEFFNPDLGIDLNRVTGIALLVKILGYKQDAMSLSLEESDQILNKYIDKYELKEDWQKKFTAFAIKNKIIKGTSENTLSPLESLEGCHLATMILNSLGYKEFDYRKSLIKLYEIEGINEKQAVEFDKPLLTRDDLVGICFYSLGAKNINSKRLIDILAENNKIQYNSSISIIPFLQNFKSNSSKLTVIAISPTGNNIDLATNISVYFSEPLDESTINLNSFSLYDNTSNKLSGKILLDSSKRILSFIPSSELKELTEYKIELKDIRSIYNNTIHSYNSVFKTGTIKGLVTSVNFYTSSVVCDNCATKSFVSLNTEKVTRFNKVIGDENPNTSELEICFNKNVDTSSISSAKICLKNTNSNQTLDLKIVEINDSKIQISLPQGELPYGKYILSIKDVALSDSIKVQEYENVFSVGKQWEIILLDGPIDGKLKSDNPSNLKFTLKLPQNVKWESINPLTIMLRKNDNFTMINCNIYNDKQNYTTTIIPINELTTNCEYSLIIKDITDYNEIECKTLEIDFSVY